MPPDRVSRFLNDGFLMEPRRPALCGEGFAQMRKPEAVQDSSAVLPQGWTERCVPEPDSGAMPQSGARPALCPIPPFTVPQPHSHFAYLFRTIHAIVMPIKNPPM